VIVVAQNYLGSINHALLTAGLEIERRSRLGLDLQRRGAHNEGDVVRWSGLARLGHIPFSNAHRRRVRAAAGRAPHGPLAAALKT